MEKNVEKCRFYTDMENNLIDSLLHDTSKPLELLLSERFNEHVHFTHLNPTYVVHFLMSLSSMLMSNQEKIVRLTILTTARGTPSRKTMKVRTFDMSGKQTGQKILLSTGEKKVMRLLLNGEASDLPPDLTKIVEDFYKNERNLEKIDLDQYTADYTVYEVDKEEMYK
uniref:Uncharacterized protein n=1 Tax=Romanomermis culicivorax TaxID=13658 RepID=A0A915L4T3_ROMCU